MIRKKCAYSGGSSNNFKSAFWASTVITVHLKDEDLLTSASRTFRISWIIRISHRPCARQSLDLPRIVYGECLVRIVEEVRIAMRLDFKIFRKD